MPPLPDAPDLIARIAASQGGAPAPAAAAAATAAPEPKASAAPTEAEKAGEAADPKDEGDKADAPAILYEIGGQKLTPQQIEGVLDRYGEANDTLSQFDPVLKLFKGMAERTGRKPEELAAFAMDAMRRAVQKNPTMGGDSDQDEPGEKGEKAGASATTQNTDVSAQLKKWAEDNSVDVPPGLAESLGAVQQMQQQVTAMGNLMVQLLRAVGGNAKVGAEGAAAAQTEVADARKQRALTNLDAAQLKYKLPDEDAQPFMEFAAERGYGIHDFLNPDLLDRVMQDFVNSKSSGELARLREQFSRRQAFTGTIDPSPAAGAATSSQAGDPYLARIADKAAASRVA